MHYEVTIKMCRQCSVKHEFLNYRQDQVKPIAAVTVKDLGCYYCGVLLEADKTQGS